MAHNRARIMTVNLFHYGYLLTRVWDVVFKTRCKYVLVRSTATSMPPTVLKKTSHTAALPRWVSSHHYGWNHIGIRSLGTCCAKAR